MDQAQVRLTRLRVHRKHAPTPGVLPMNIYGLCRNQRITPTSWGVKRQGRPIFRPGSPFGRVSRNPIHSWPGRPPQDTLVQAGPHASGCDEPGQVGRSSPKSFPRVPWSARPFRAVLPNRSLLAALDLAGRHWHTHGAGTPLRRLRRSLLRDPHPWPRGQPGPSTLEIQPEFRQARPETGWILEENGAHPRFLGALEIRAVVIHQERPVG